MIAEGGYIPHTDHICPPDIPFANYCYYICDASAKGARKDSA